MDSYQLVCDHCHFLRCCVNQFYFVILLDPPKVPLSVLVTMQINGVDSKVSETVYLIMNDCN